MGQYDDIIHLPHHQSDRHPPMPLHDRAAQFAPFAALVGYGDAVEETARFTDRKVELGDNRVEELDALLQALHGKEKELPTVRLVCFVPDKSKSGGAYVTKHLRVKKVDALRGVLIADSGEEIPLDDLVDLEIKE